MKSVGIEMVVLIRSGYKRWQTLPSKVLTEQESCFTPPIDLVELFLKLNDKYGMKFFLDSTIRQVTGLMTTSGQMGAMNVKWE